MKLKDKGLTGLDLENAFQPEAVKIMNKHLSLDKSTRNPSGTKHIEIQVVTNNGVSFIKPVIVEDKVKHDIDDVDNFLEHFGVLGMHWGHKKGKSNSHEDDSEDFKKKESLKKRKTRTMSNAELKALNERLQLEKQYKDLTKSEISPGKKFVINALNEIGKEVLKSTIKSALTGDLKTNQYAKIFKNGANITKNVTNKKKPIGFRMG
jgi:hypothetical protein